MFNKGDKSAAHLFAELVLQRKLPALKICHQVLQLSSHLDIFVVFFFNNTTGYILVLV